MNVRTVICTVILVDSATLMIGLIVLGVEAYSIVYLKDSWAVE